MNDLENFPKVSVVIPVYNGAGFVFDALDSVFYQDYPNMEVIVINDCSTDDTLMVLNSYPHPIKVITNKNNEGASYTRNQGIREACGKFIAFLDADDIWVKNKLTQQIKLLLDHQNVGLIYGKSKLTTYVNSEKIDIDEFINGSNYELKSLKDVFLNPYFSTSTIVVKTALCMAVGLFKEELKTAEDVDFVLEIASKAPVIKMNSVLSSTRRLENSLGSADSSYQDNLQVIKQFLKKHPNFLIEHKLLINKVIRKIYDDWIDNLVFQRKINSAISIGLTSLTKCNPSKKTFYLLAKALALSFTKR